jgi:hypothetical protein
VRNAIRAALENGQTQGIRSSSDVSSGMAVEGYATYHTTSAESLESRAERILVLVQNQHEY